MKLQILGNKMVLISPPYRSEGVEWYFRYQPQDYRVIDNHLGNTQDVKAMIKALGKRDVVVYSDVVFNHMANESFKRSDLNYPGDAVLNEYKTRRNYFEKQKLFGNLDQNLFSANDFHQPPRCITNYSDTGDVQFNRLCGGSGDRGLPDLKPNRWVVKQQQNYLKALKRLGVKGFRIDAAKHMSNEHINAVFTPSIIANTHVFGEVITTGNIGTTEYDRFLAPYLRETGHSAYDFPLFNTIRESFQFGGALSNLIDPLAFGKSLQPSKAITFVITHDIPNNAGFRYQIMGPQDEHLAYAYILGRDGGVPMVYTDHNESGDDRWVEAYKRSDIRNMIRFHNKTQGSGMQIIGHGDCFLLFKRDDKGVVGINKCGSNQEYWVDTDVYKLQRNKNYRNVFDGNDVEVIKTQWHRFVIPARQSKLWLLD
jgi:alpha-amylase